MKYNKQECLDKGLQLLENSKDWPKCVEIRFNDIYEGADVSHFIELVEMQKADKSIKEIRQAIIDENHSGCSYSIVKSLAKHFYPYILDAFYK